MEKKIHTRIAGIDQSLNSTGVCVMDSVTGKVLFSLAISLNKNKSTPSVFGIERLSHIRNVIKDILKKYEVTFLSLEGYSYGSRGRSLFELGEIGGAVRILAFDLGIKFEVIPPKTLKKYITGNGNSDKDQMAQVVKEKYGLEFKTSDEADAFGLAAMTIEIGPDKIKEFCYDIKEKAKEKKLKKKKKIKT